MTNSRNSNPAVGITRRKFALATGAAGIVGLSGCLGGDDEDDADLNGNGDPSGNGEVSDGVVDVEHVQSTWEDVPQDHHYNPYNPTGFESDGSYAHLFDPLAQYFHPEGFTPIIASDWSTEDNVMVINLKEDYTWHNGDSVTSQDVIGKFQLDILNGYPISNLAEDITAPDDHTVEIQLVDGNPEVAEFNILETLIDTKYDVYEEYIEAFVDADGDESAYEDIQSDLLDFRYEDGIGNGPFILENRDSSEVLLTRNDDYPDHGGANFQTLRMVGITDNEDRVQGSVAGQLDFTPVNIAAEAIADQLPDDEGDLVFFEAYHGSSLLFNQDEGWYDQREVRQAIAYILDASEIAPAIWGPLQALQTEYPIGLVENQWDEWIGDDLELYNKYEPDHDQAASLLEEVGFEEDGGTWYDPNGDQWTVVITMPAGWDTQIGGYTVANHQLEDFGINAELETIENTAYFGNTLPNSDFDIGWCPYGGSLPHPYFSFEEIRQDGFTHASVPNEVSVPPFGEPDGSEETVDRVELLDELGLTNNPDREQEIVKELCWIQNVDLPTYITAQKIDLNWMRTDEWDVPAADGPFTAGTGRPAHALPKIGKLNAKTD